MNVDDQTVGIWQQERIVLRQAVHFQDNAGLIVLELGHTNLLQETVVHIEAFANQRRSQRRTPQIEEDAVGAVDTLRLELHILFQINSYPRVIGSGPMPYTGDPSQPA